MARFSSRSPRVGTYDTGGDEKDRQLEARPETQPQWWLDLTTEQREIHYNRTRKCNHEYKFPFPEHPELRDAYSYDPYAHTSHSPPHSAELFFMGKCPCNTCVLGFGIERGTEIKRVNEEQVREKMKARVQHVECFCEACWKKKRPDVVD